MLNWVSLSVACHSDFYISAFYVIRQISLHASNENTEFAPLNPWNYVYNVIKNSLIRSVILIFYSPIAKKWLYNAHIEEKIMSALESVGSQDFAREI